MNVHIDTLPPRKSYKGVRVGMDIELLGAEKRRLHRDTGEFGSFAIATSSKEVYVLSNIKLFREAVSRVRDADWVFHNAPFDVRQMRRWAQVGRRLVHDTLNYERLLYSGYYDNFRLKDLARRYFRVQLDKEARDAFTEGRELTREMLRYNGKDAVVTLRIVEKQLEVLDKDDLRIYRDCDLPALWAILDFQGFPIDERGWRELAIYNQERFQEIADWLGFNPNSTQQTQAALRKSGFQVTNSAAGTLERCARQGSEIAEYVLLAREAGKRASTYGLVFAEEFIEADGRVYARFNPTGPKTGRGSCADPNLQNIPNELAFRRLFLGVDGGWVCKLDWSQQEVRIMAQMSGDRALIRAFESGDDIYIEVYRDMFGRTIGKDSKERKYIKAVVLGLQYGLTEYGLSRQLDMDVEDARYLISAFFKHFPGVRDYIEYQRKSRKPFVQTLWGRKFWSNPYSRKSLNQVINAPIQGGAADMKKYALGRHHKSWRKQDGPYPVVADVHDEFVLVSKYKRDAVRWGNEMKEQMLYAMQKMLPDIPPGVDMTVARTWAGEEG